MIYLEPSIFKIISYVGRVKKPRCSAPAVLKFTTVAPNFWSRSADKMVALAHYMMKLSLFPEWGKWAIFGPKIKTFKTFLQICSLDFSVVVADDKHQKNNLKWLFHIFEESFFDVWNGVNGRFLEPKSLFWHSLNLFIIFF